MNRTPWDEVLVGASNHLARLQERAAQMQSFIAMGLGDGCLPVDEAHLENIEEDFNLFLGRIRIAMNHQEEPTMVLRDPAKGPEPLYPNQPTYCEKYGHPKKLGSTRCLVCGKKL